MADTKPKKHAAARLTSKRLREVLPSFDPSTYRARHQKPTIVVSDEEDCRETALNKRDQSGPLKPLPGAALAPIPEYTGLADQEQSNPSPISSLSEVSDSSSIEARLARLRATSMESTFSQWSQPNSSSSLLPPPLSIGQQKGANGDSQTRVANSTGPYENIREMYSYETLDYAALLDEVAESPGKRVWRKLPFKKRSRLEVAPNQGESSLSATAEDTVKPNVRTAAGKVSTRQRSASTVVSIASSLPMPPVPNFYKNTTSSQGTQTSEKSSVLLNDDAIATSSTIANFSAPIISNPTQHHQAGWRTHVPTRCRPSSPPGAPALVRTASGHRILRLQEAIYDDEGNIVYRSLLPTSLQADDSTRLLVHPMSTSDSDIIQWDSLEKGEVLRGNICLGRDILGSLDNESVVWTRDESGLALEEVQAELGRMGDKGRRRRAQTDLR